MATDDLQNFNYKFRQLCGLGIAVNGPGPLETTHPLLPPLPTSLPAYSSRTHSQVSREIPPPPKFSTTTTTSPPGLIIIGTANGFPLKNFHPYPNQVAKTKVGLCPYCRTSWASIV